MNQETGNSSSTDQIEIQSHKEFREYIKKSQDNKLGHLVRIVVMDELALLAEDLIENGSEPSSVYKSFIKIAGTLIERL